MRASIRFDRLIRGGLLGGGLLVASLALVGAQDEPGKADEPATKPVAAASASYVGSAACKACHARTCDSWSGSPHGKALTQDTLPAEIKGCEACHGPASIHISTGAQNTPPVPKANDPTGVNSTCGKCHLQSDASKAPKEWQNIAGGNFARGAHSRKGLSCLSCHSGHPNGNDKALIKPSQDLCIGCHGQVLESSPGKKAAYTHSPVASGKCTMCHDPHGASGRGVVVSNISAVCQSCHNVNDAKISAAHGSQAMADSKCTQCHDPHSHEKDGKLLPSNRHMPFKQGKCEICHTKPEPGKPIGLNKPAKELCFSCHPASVMIPEGGKAHLPVKEGLCTTCHSPHASSEKALLKTRVAYTCFSCHVKIEDATVAEHRHKVLEADLNCMMCHKPHSSAQENLLVNDEVTMCGQCHKHSFSHPIAKNADGTTVLDPTTGKVLICSSCHDIHGSRFESLTTSEKTKDLCVKCHTKLEH